MKVIVAGSRTITSVQPVYRAIAASGFDPDEIVSGGARGVDKLGERVAEQMFVALKVFPADWGKYGKGAGYIRNKEMAEYADALIAVWNGTSRGTAHMIKTMEALGKPVFVYKTS